MADCYSCNGTGYFTHKSGNKSRCKKCCGTGDFKRPQRTLLETVVYTAVRAYIKAKIG